MSHVSFRARKTFSFLHPLLSIHAKRARGLYPFFGPQFNQYSFCEPCVVKGNDH